MFEAITSFFQTITTYLVDLQFAIHTEAVILWWLLLCLGITAGAIAVGWFFEKARPYAGVAFLMAWSFFTGAIKMHNVDKQKPKPVAKPVTPKPREWGWQ